MAAIKNGAHKEIDELDAPELVAIDKTVHVSGTLEGATVLDCVRRAFPEFSAREVYKKSRTGEVVVDAKRRDPLYKVSAGQIITVTVHRPQKPSEKPVLRQNEWVQTPAGPLVVVWEDEDLLAVSKPPGCVSHPALGRSGDTLIERVRHLLVMDPEGQFTPALANRLDIDTSGIVLVGKNKKARTKLGFLIQRRRIEKRYLALVGGAPPPEGEITLALERRPDSRELARYPKGHHKLIPKMQDAHTRYRVAFKAVNPLDATLVEIELVTGRTHQIRRHFAMAGHPVARDKRYGDKGFNALVKDVTGLSRMFLHAYKVSLPHPITRNNIEITCALPDELAHCMEAFGPGGWRDYVDSGQT